MAVLVTLLLSVDTVAATQPLTASVYRTKARLVCAAAEKQFKAVTTQPDTPNDPSLDLKNSLRETKAVIPIERSEIAGLAALRPPTSLAKLVSSGIQAKRQLFSGMLKLAQMTAHPTSPKNEQQMAEFGLLFQMAALDSRVTRIWKQIGVPSCQN